MDAQAGSPLMSAPAEIRRAIYDDIIPSRIHLFLSAQGRMEASSCLVPAGSLPSGGFFQDGYDRRPAGLDPYKHHQDDPVWARRLGSSWGPHWECEEAALAEAHQQYMGSLLAVCKKMFLDICHLLTETASVDVTDLATLDVLVRKPAESTPGPGNFWNLANHIYPMIKTLNVTLRLPLAFYEQLEAVQDGRLAIASPHTEGDEISAAHTTWARVWPAVCQMPLLRKLGVWLDHDAASSWSVVRERRAVGDGLMTVLASHLQARARAGNAPPVEVLFNLPKLHPNIARPDTHFVPADSPPAPFAVERRFRLRHHCEEAADGRLRVRHEADFPVTKDLVFFNKPWVGADLNAVSDDEIRVVEDFERTLWERGENVHVFLEHAKSHRLSFCY